MEAGYVLIIIVLVALPVAAIAFATGAGRALSEIGKGAFAIDKEEVAQKGSSGPVTAASREEREAEIRQMVEASSYRREARGESPLDVDAEVGKLLKADSGPAAGADRELREEVRQLVVARNERRLRQGKNELDVDTEVERQLTELQNLGQ